MFPTYKTSKKYRDVLVEKYGINDCTFNGSIEDMGIYPKKVLG